MWTDVYAREGGGGGGSWCLIWSFSGLPSFRLAADVHMLQRVDGWDQLTGNPSLSSLCSAAKTAALLNRGSWTALRTSQSGWKIPATTGWNAMKVLTVTQRDLRMIPLTLLIPTFSFSAISRSKCHLCGENISIYKMGWSKWFQGHSLCPPELL